MQRKKEKLKIIEIVDRYTFFNSLLPGMVYYSQGIPYRIVRIEKKNKRWIAYAIREEKETETFPISDEIIEVKKEWGEKKVYNNIKVSLGVINVTKYYLGYFDKTLNKTIFYEEPFNYSFKPNALIIRLDPKLVDNVGQEEYNYFVEKLKKIDKRWYEHLEAVEDIDPLKLYNRYRGAATQKLYEYLAKIVPGNSKKAKTIRFYLKKIVDSKAALQSGLHAIEHNLIKISPVITNVDSRELGGYSMIINKTPTIYIYEAYEGGVGLVDALYEKIEQLLEYSLQRISSCNCLDGCPSCILSPKCGNANQLLDKYAAKFILKKILNKG